MNEDSLEIGYFYWLSSQIKKKLCWHFSIAILCVWRPFLKMAAKFKPGHILINDILPKYIDLTHYLAFSLEKYNEGTLSHKFSTFFVKKFVKISKQRPFLAKFLP